MFHYTYSIRYTDQPNVYYGVRTSRKPPEQDVNYWGSPATFKAWMDAHEASRVKTILAVYDSREEAELAEDELIEQQWESDKPLSLNGSVRGAKFNALGRKNTPEHIEALRENRSKPFYLVSPTGQVFQGMNLRQFCRDNNLFNPDCSSVIRGLSFHHKGWTASLEAHKLYLEYFTDRGISWLKSRRCWRVKWYENSKQKQKSFKSKVDVIAFRASLEQNGYEFQVHPRKWQERLANIQTTA